MTRAQVQCSEEDLGDKCDEDMGCPDNQLCCTDACGMKCMLPYIRGKMLEQALLHVNLVVTNESMVEILHAELPIIAEVVHFRHHDFCIMAEVVHFRHHEFCIMAKAVHLRHHDFCIMAEAV